MERKSVQIQESKSMGLGIRHIWFWHQDPGFEDQDFACRNPNPGFRNQWYRIQESYSQIKYQWSWNTIPKLKSWSQNSDSLIQVSRFFFRIWLKYSISQKNCEFVAIFLIPSAIFRLRSFPPHHKIYCYFYHLFQKILCQQFIYTFIDQISRNEFLIKPVFN